MDVIDNNYAMICHPSDQQGLEALRAQGLYEITQELYQLIWIICRTKVPYNESSPGMLRLLSRRKEVVETNGRATVNHTMKKLTSKRTYRGRR